MGGGRPVTPISMPSSMSCSSKTLPSEFAQYVAFSQLSDEDESDDSCVCDDAEDENFHYARRRLQDRSLREAKDLLRRYKPGDWIEGAGATKAGDYVLPEITTLLLVGPKGAGKSTLVNRITRVFDKDECRCQVHGRETLKNIAERLMGLDAVIEATIILLCIVILLLRFSDKLLKS